MNLIICAIIFGILQHYQHGGAIGEKVVSQELSPYIELVLCPGRQQPWNCARDQTARLLDEMNDIVKYQWQMLKVEADQELNTTIMQRGFSSSDVKEKPSTILKKIEIGTNFIQNFVEHTADAMMGRERNDDYEEDDDDDENYDDDDDDDDEVEENSVINKNLKTKIDNKNQIQQKKQAEELKKKGQVSLQPALVLLQSQKPHQHGIHLGGQAGHGQHGGGGGHGGHLGNLIGHKFGHKKKKKRPFGGHGGLLGGGHGGSLMSFFHHNSEIGTSALSFLEDLLDSGVSGIPHTHGLSSINNGRSIGVGRGKKKKKKALMKLMLIGTIIKGKIELLLKVLSAHLQIKFFAIALVGLIINIARFWIDVKRGGVPQKVIYYEHAHHQHHYEDHGNVASSDDWTAGTGPSSNSGYWKRSIGEKKREAKSFPPLEENSSTSYGNSPVYSNNAEQYSAGTYNSDPSYLAYSSQLPSYY